MTRILFVKTSSLGDVVHQMPAIVDARAHLPQAHFSWVVEEGFAPLARLHPMIDEVIPVATRRWRGSLLSAATWREIGAFRRGLRDTAFDAVVDTQGLIRSALIARMAQGVKHGYDADSIREPFASRFYDIRHTVSRDQHAVVRNRALVAQALGFAEGAPLDYGLRRVTAAPAPYAVLLHGTSRADKEWPEDNWIAVGRALRQRGLGVMLPWGSEAERARSGRLSRAIEGSVVPERTPLDETAKLIGAASLVVGVDTGLLHLAAALTVPLVGLFVATDPAKTGPVGTGAIDILGGKAMMPLPDDVVAAVERVLWR
jgi:heptosyltransferase-1